MKKTNDERTSKKTGSSDVPSSPTTLGCVAKSAGVSPSTVSRILNGTAKVSEEKRKAVESAIEKFGYRPNPIARGLAGGRTFSIGVITQAIDSPFYGEGLRGIEDVLDIAGYIPLYVSGHWDPMNEKKCLDMLMSRRVDGIIMLTGQMSNKLLTAVAQQVPLVITGRKVKAPNLLSLNFDNVGGARLATRHLIDLGHRRIAHIAGDSKHQDAIERLEGYRSALEEASIEFDPSIVFPGNFQEASGLMAVNRWVESQQNFTAIFAANDQMAFGASLGLYRKNLRVPEDVSIVGFDDQHAALYSIPPLTTVRQPVYEMGRLAAQAILNLIDRTVPVADLPEPQLIARESTRRLRR